MRESQSMADQDRGRGRGEGEDELVELVKGEFIESHGFKYTGAHEHDGRVGHEQQFNVSQIHTYVLIVLDSTILV